MPFGPTPGLMPVGAIRIPVGSDIQSIVNAAPNGATFWLESGVHRMQSIEPKDNQKFIGADGAVLNGSERLVSFTQEGGRWVASGQTQQGERIATDEGEPGFLRAGYPDSFFIDNKPLKPVDALSKVATGTFYFDYDANKIYFADNPTGHVVEAAKTAQAFGGQATGVTVQDLVIEKYANPTQHAAVQGGDSWVIQDNDIRLNYGVGANAQSNGKIVGNYIHDNGEMGLDGGGTNLLVENNEIARNGNWSGIDVFWEGGGAKFTETTNLVVRGNYSHDNHGFGLWTDIDNFNALYENNVLARNTGGGITHEISYDAVIRNNTFAGNGSKAQGDEYGTKGHGDNWIWGGAIQIQNSQRVDIYGNKIDMTGAEGGNGIGLVQQDRGSGNRGLYVTVDNKIHDNVIVSTDGNGLSGGAGDWNEAGLLNGGNVWTNNQYFMKDGDHWWWGDTNTFAEFKAASKETGLRSEAYPNTSTWDDAPGGSVTPPPPPPPPIDPPSGGTGNPVIAVDDIYKIDAGKTFYFNTKYLAFNDKGADGGLKVTALDKVTGSGVAVSWAADGTAIYKAPAGNSTDSLGYMVTDKDGSSDAGTLFFQVGNTAAAVTALKASATNTVEGTAGNNTLTGNGNGNILNGRGGADVINGNGGKDVIDGGAGSDRLSGGTGGDYFIFTKGVAGSDDILDFNRTDGDRIVTDFKPTDIRGWDTESLTFNGAQETLHGVGHVWTPADFLFS